MEWNSRGHWKWFLSSNSKYSADIFTPNISKDALMQAGSEAAFNFWRQWLLYCKVSCLFTKHILASGFETVDGTEILRTPKRRSSIARHSIPSTFFCGSAVCLLISQNVNKKNYATFKMGIFGSETTKNQLLSIKLLPKVIFRNFFTHICSYLFTFSITLKCKQMAVSL